MQIKGYLNLYDRELLSIAEYNRHEWEIDADGEWTRAPDWKKQINHSEQECLFGIRLNGENNFNLCKYLIENKYDEEFKLLIANYLLVRNKFKIPSSENNKYSLDDYTYKDTGAVLDALTEFLRDIFTERWGEEIEEDYERAAREIKEKYYQSDQIDRDYMTYLKNAPL